MNVCPVCEAQNPPGASECGGCGKIIAAASIDVDVAAIDGLEPTFVPGPAAVDSLPLAGLELTQVSNRDEILVVPDEVSVEPTRLEEDASAPMFWTITPVELDRGRESDDGARTEAPLESPACPYCGTPSLDAVCGSCGMRKARYTRAPERAAAAPAGADDTMLCPACFARVPSGPRCIECGVPFAAREP